MDTGAIKNFFKNNLLYILLSFVGIVILLTIYRIYFELNNKEIQVYINDEVIKYNQEDRAAIQKIISEGVDYILLHENLYKQVKRSAKAGNIAIEQELVHAAIMQCRAFGYLAA